MREPQGEDKVETYHNELRIPTNTKERHASASKLVQRNTCEAVDNVRHSGKFIKPVFNFIIRLG